MDARSKKPIDARSGTSYMRWRTDECQSRSRALFVDTEVDFDAGESMLNLKAERRSSLEETAR